jgi:hypothetical protein
MRNRFPTPLLGMMLCALALSALPVRAQLASQYRVELLVFSNPAGGAAEQWEATPELAYPRAAQFLMPAEEVATATPPLPLQSAAANPALPLQTPTINPAPPPPPSTAFVMLPASQRELAANAAAIQRSGRYHILFHEAWTQPITGQGAAVPIALDRSGDGGPWPALQGTIKIYQAGAFFLDTNLWLNTSGEYLPGTWRMPAPPRAPASRNVELAAPVEPVVPDGQPGVIPSTASAPEAAPAPADYPYRHAVLLKQSRKMRGGQLNYIDHPLLGVLVKITPLTATASEPAIPGSI